MADLSSDLPTLSVSAASWEAIFDPPSKYELEAALPRFLQPRRWFAGKARQIQSVALLDAVPLPGLPNPARIALIKIDYSEGEPDAYVLCFAFAAGHTAEQVAESLSTNIIARLEIKAGMGVLYEALAEKNTATALLEAIAHNRQLKGLCGMVVALPTQAFEQLRGTEERLDASAMNAEQSNTSIVYGDRLILKVFRRLHEGINPDVEIGTFLTERTSFRHFPPVAGTLSYYRDADEPVSMAILQGFVPNQGDAWQYTLEALGQFFREVTRTRAERQRNLPCGPGGTKSYRPGTTVAALLHDDSPPIARDLMGAYLNAAALLGQRTAEMHAALASDHADPAFAPEPFNESHQLSVYDASRALVPKIFDLFRSRLDMIPENARTEGERVLAAEQEILARFHTVLEHKITAMRTRTHGDFHLGQVLRAGDDFIIIDFEGEPGRTVSERRAKISPLRDVSGMIRSLHYAAYSSLIRPDAGIAMSPTDVDDLEFWAQCWYTWASSGFLKSYLSAAGRAEFVPQSRKELEILLEAYLLEKAIYELGYELNNRPDWVRFPLRGILQLLEAGI